MANLAIAFAAGLTLGILIKTRWQRKPIEFNSPVDALRYLINLETKQEKPRG
jgi:hypothetical protein